MKELVSVIFITIMLSCDYICFSFLKNLKVEKYVKYKNQVILRERVLQPVVPPEMFLVATFRFC